MLEPRSPRTRRGGGILALGLAVALTAVGTPGVTAEAGARAAGTVLQPDSPDAIVIHSAGLEALMPDERDAVLRKALSMLPDRLLELGDELPDFPRLPEPLVRAIADGLASPMTLSIDVPDPAAGGPPIRLQLTVQPEDPEAARRMGEVIRELLRSEGVELQPIEGTGLAGTPAPFGELRMGVRPFDGVSTFVLAANRPGGSVPELPDVRLPEGVEPAFAMRFDTARLSPAFEQAMAAQGGVPEQRELLDAFGIGGQQGVAGTVAYGVDDRRSHLVVVLQDHEPLARRLGVDPGRTLSDAELRTIPRDVVAVEATITDLAQVGELLERVAAAEGAPAGFWEEAEAALGFHPRTDLLDHLGDTVTVYRSDLTGGGGLISTVLLLGLDDPARIAETHAEIVRRFNAEATPQTNGYLSIRPRSMGGRTLFTLSFNGLPIPLQPTWGIEGGHLVVAATPAAALAAMRQVAGEGPSILDHDAIVEMAGGSLEGLVSLRYLDLPRMAGRGYGTASLVATALANAVRSPRTAGGEEGRDPGMPMPSFAEFTDGVVPMFGAARWEDGDLVTDLQSDRSALVSLAGAFESAGGIAGAAAVAGMVGGMLPALEQAREAAREARARAAMEAIVTAIELHRLDHGAPPDALEDLVEAGLLDAASLASPAGAAPDGGPAIAYRGSKAGSRDGAVVLLVDRAMLAAQDESFVVFADGRVGRLWGWDLAERLQQPANRGAVEELRLGEILRWYLED